MTGVQTCALPIWLETISPILRRDASLRGLLRSRGFRAVSAAIRASTLGAQALRNQGRISEEVLHSVQEALDLEALQPER